MQRSWLTGMVSGGLAALLMLGLVSWSGAQSGNAPTGRVACVNVVKAFNEFQRQKDLTEEMNELQTQLQNENVDRRKKIDALQAEIDKMDPDEAKYVERTREMLSLQIDYKNWVDLRQADMTREIGLWSIRIYREIVKATEELAQHDGYDLVLYKGEFEMVSMDPETVKQQIRSLQVLYANSAIDITQKVTDKLNADYRSQPRVKMMYVP